MLLSNTILFSSHVKVGVLENVIMIVFLKQIHSKIHKNNTYQNILKT
jgi:hypothetical protein